MRIKISINVKYITYVLHLLIWSGLFLLPYLVSNSANDYRIGAIPGVVFSGTILVNMVIFYANTFYLYPQLYNKRYWWLYIITIILLLLASFWLKFYLIGALSTGMMKKATAGRFVFSSSIAVLIISLIYCRIVAGIRQEREQKEKQAAQLSTELKFLRSQVSPHFLFNVLTNMVSLARKNSDKLETSLLMLSDLMRYMLYDARETKVELRKEVEYLNCYIALQKLRFGNDVNIESTIKLDEEANHYTVEPMLLIPFVENAFKHGTGNLDQAYISIKLLATQKLLVFEVLNSFDDASHDSSDENSGIGLSNVRSRLELLYKNKYTLTINDKNNLFYIILTLELA
jgi:two-component system LytT family sensor kinase